MRNILPEVDCCAYREKLLAKRKKDARSRKKPRNVTGGCCSAKRLTCDEISKVTAECSTTKLKKKIKRIKRPDAGCPPDIDKLFPQIKPSISEREKYVNIIHIVCVLEAEELIRMKEIQKIRDKLKQREEDENDIQTDNDTKVEQTSSLTKSQNSEVNSEENQEKDRLSVRGKTSEHENKKKGSKMKMTAGKSTKIECNSICSFDSEVDLTGLHLTKEDVRQIEKDREQLRQQQNSECESENSTAEE